MKKSKKHGFGTAGSMDVLLQKHLAAGLASSVPLGAGSSEVKPLHA